jgi:multiple sugar transport system permease protein
MGGRAVRKKILMHVLLVPFLAFALFPFYHMTLTSLKKDQELYDRHSVPLIIKQGPTLEHYTKLLWDTEFLTWTKNSLLVTVLSTFVSVILARSRRMRSRG